MNSRFISNFALFILFGVVSCQKKSTNVVATSAKTSAQPTEVLVIDSVYGMYSDYCSFDVYNFQIDTPARYAITHINDAMVAFSGNLYRMQYISQTSALSIPSFDSVILNINSAGYYTLVKSGDSNETITFRNDSLFIAGFFTADCGDKLEQIIFKGSIIHAATYRQL